MEKDITNGGVKMSKCFQSVQHGKNNLISGLIAVIAIAAVAFGCTCGNAFDLGNIAKSDNPSNKSTNSSSDNDTFSSEGEVPPLSTSESMVHDLTADFARAIRSNDWSEIYNDASTDFQSTYTEEQMKNAFKLFVNKKGVVGPILDKTATMTPEFTPSPYIRTEKGLSILVLNGKFATKPVPMNFEYEFVQRGGEWKMLKLIVKLV